MAANFQTLGYEAVQKTLPMVKMAIQLDKRSQKLYDLSVNKNGRRFQKFEIGSSNKDSPDGKND